MKKGVRFAAPCQVSPSTGFRCSGIPEFGNTGLVHLLALHPEGAAVLLAAALQYRCRSTICNIYDLQNLRSTICTIYNIYGLTGYDV